MAHTFGSLAHLGLRDIDPDEPHNAPAAVISARLTIAIGVAVITSVYFYAPVATHVDGTMGASLLIVIAAFALSLGTIWFLPRQADPEMAH